MAATSSSPRRRAAVRRRRLSASFLIRSPYGDDVHRYLEGLLLAANDHTADGANIAVVAPPSKGDMLNRGEQVVGWVHVNPPEAGAEEADPGVRGVGAEEFGLSGRRHLVNVRSYPNSGL